MSHNTADSGRDGAESDTEATNGVFDAFEAAIEWFHHQLDRRIADHLDSGTHPARPTTAREYFEEVRGWDSATIDAKQLGYAPADGSGLLNHLKDAGFDRDAILGTGLFTEGLRPLWQGRYVFPYFNADGEPVYAITRVTGGKGGGAQGYGGHPVDGMSGKYAKPAHTKEYARVEEPIYGTETIEPGQPVIITEGIADAITAHEAGYPCISPVTKEFKREHHGELLDLIEAYDIPRVFLVQDNERAGFSRIDSDETPADPAHIYQVLNLPKVASGIGGALRTAHFLTEEGIDARVGTLPRTGLRKVDLDDYLLDGWASDLDVVLRAAKPPTAHPDFEASVDGRTIHDPDAGSEQGAGIPADRPDTDSDLAAGRTDGMPALWDLPLKAVNPDLEEGHRGKNPLGHIGDSKNYFQVFRPEEDGDLLAKDYKRSVRYNGLTYLLVEEEVRDVGAPEGQLSPEETWKAWSEARERGLLGRTDTIPAAALRYIAEDREFYDFEQLPEQTEEGHPPALPAKAHNAALWWVKQRWWPNVRDEDDETEATARSKQDADQVTARTWEDVRYCYEQIEANKYGRHAARQLLRSKYDFMTLVEWEQLYVYDAETGTFTPELSEINGEIADGLGVHWSSHERSEIIGGIKQHNVIESRHLNGRGTFDTPHICVENGVLDLFERELKPHSPEHHFVDRIPTAFDREASTEPYEDFLDDLTSREADKLTMIEMVGHALVPDANERYKKFLVLHGGADNGKTEFFDRVSTLLQGPSGSEGNVSNVKLEKLASNRFSTNSIYGHMANIAGEIDGKKIRNTATLKDISGGDRMEIEPKGADSFFDKINATLMFAANDPPIIGERDKKAIASRIVPVELPFTFVSNPTGEFEKRKRSTSDLDAQLATDEAMSGLLNLALDGIERLEANEDVSLPEDEYERLDRYESAADPMAEFAEECLTNHASDYIVKDDVTAIFKAFAEERGHEVGGEIHATLHSVIKGSVSLNYADGRPQSPDYATTSLPLRPWDERKYVIKRITLTDEGLKHARAAGLVVDEDDATVESATSESPTTIAALEPGERVDLTVCTAGVERNPPQWVDGRGTFRFGDEAKVSYQTQGMDPEFDVGCEYDLRDAVVGTNMDGETILKLRVGMTEIAPMEGEESETSGSDGDGNDDGDQLIEVEPQPATAATDGGGDVADEDEQASEDDDTEDTPTQSDESAREASEAGGPPADAAGGRADAARVLHQLRMLETDKPVSRPEIAVALDDEMSPERVDAAIEKLLREGEITEPERASYRPT